MEPAPPIAAQVAAFLDARPGELAWRWLGPREGPTALWEVRAPARRVIVKRHLRGRGFAQEHAAYRALARPLARWLPELLAADPPLGLLVLTYLPGLPASEPSLTPVPDTLAPARDPTPIHHEAGAFLRALHEAHLPGADDPLPLAEALRRRCAAALRRAAALVPAGDLDRLAARVARTRAFDDAPRLPAHRDFGPWNWRYDPSAARLGVLDWEHARPDAAVVDRVRLRVDAWARRPDLAAAFDRGYGRPQGDREEEQLDLLCHLHAVATLAWSARHGDTALAAAARDELDRHAGRPAR